MALIMSSGGQGLGIILILRFAQPDPPILVSAPQTRVNRAPLGFDGFVERNFLPESSGRRSGRMFLPRTAARGLCDFFKVDLLVGTFVSPLILRPEMGRLFSVQINELVGQITR